MGNVEKDTFKGNNFVGEVHDSVKFVEDGEVTLQDGTKIKGKAGELVELPIGYNLVVDNFSKLIATFLKGTTSFTNNLWWEIGEGNSSWIDSKPPSPVASDIKLLSPSFRKKVLMTDVNYITEQGAVTSAITNRLEVKVIFGSTEANGNLREFGIFAGGSSALGSGLMINRKTHGLIYKTSGIELHRKIHFKFLTGGN